MTAASESTAPAAARRMPSLARNVLWNWGTLVFTMAVQFVHEYLKER